MMNELLSALSNVVGKIDDCVYDLEDVRDMVEEARDAIDYDETEYELPSLTADLSQGTGNVVAYYDYCPADDVIYCHVSY